jgi:NADPH:quinone reductase-like Zn-dependent oxidoreductase
VPGESRVSVRAARLHSENDGLRLQLDEIAIPVPGAGEVLIRVHACGLNRVDLLTRDGQAVPPELPHTPGSEVAGAIVQLGDGVDGWKPGERVAVDPIITCGACVFCRSGRSNMCLHATVFGVQSHGGYADYVVAQVGQLVRLPEGVSCEAAASVIAAGATAWQMLMRRAQVRAAERVLVIAGGSGLGSMAVQIAKLAGAQVAATAGDGAKCARAEGLGADFTVNHREPGWAQAVRGWSGGRGVDLVVEHVGAATWDDSLAALTRGGRLVTCGGHSGFDVQLNLWSLFVKGQSILGSFAATRQDILDVLSLVAEGRLQPVIDSVLPLGEAAQAQRQLDERGAFGKILLRPLETPA